MTMLIIMHMWLREPRVFWPERQRPNGGQLCLGPTDGPSFEAVTDVRINHATFGGTNLIVALITIEEWELEMGLHPRMMENHPDFLSWRIAIPKMICDLWFAWIYVYGKAWIVFLAFVGHYAKWNFPFWQVEMLCFRVCLSAVAIEICVTRHKTSIVPRMAWAGPLLIYVGAIKTSSHCHRWDWGGLFTLQWEIWCNLAHVFS